MDDELSEIERLNRTKSLLLKWKNDKNIQELKKFYDTKSFSGILGVERREMSHSSFIAWILNDTESHNLGQFAIRQLFDILLENAEDKIKNGLDRYNLNKLQQLGYKDLYKALMLNTYDIQDLEVLVEDPLKIGNKGGRIDIICSMTLLSRKVNIIIENKVDSKEHEKQTQKYHEYYTKDDKYNKAINLFVYLTPNDDTPTDEHFIKINYQQISKNIFERALNHDISDRVKFIINEYLLSLRKPSKKGIIMAVGNLEEELLIDFWNQHRDLIEAASDATIKSSKSSDADQELATAISKSIKKSKVRYANLDDYIKSVSQNKDIENIKRLRRLIEEIESKFENTIDITYASNINIKNTKSKKRGKAFVWIDVNKNNIYLTFHLIDSYKRIYDKGLLAFKMDESKNNCRIILTGENESKLNEYLDILEQEFNELQ